jgi:glycosyltransferase involved in cell wall biosynthesis
MSWTLRRGIRALRLVRTWIGLTNYLLANRPALIQFGKINFPFEALFLARLRRRGLVLAQINHEFERRESNGVFARQIDQMYASTYQNFSAIFFHADENRERFLSIFDVPREVTHIIPHGNQEIFRKLAVRKKVEVNYREKYGLEGGEPIVLFFGVIAPSQGLPDLIDAFSLVAGQTNAKLVVAGYPSKYVNVHDIRHHIDRLGLSERVILDARYIPNEEIGDLSGGGGEERVPGGASLAGSFG